MSVNDNEIDAVISWVDGNDPVHQEKRRHVEHAEQNFKTELLTGRDQTRFIDNGELEFCVYSIRKFAPWIRKIFIITDDQHPEFLTSELMKTLNVGIIDHKEIFSTYEWALPTFNSRTIESMLWRINGLASKFIYFNDDFILTKPVQKEDFFTADRVVLRGKWNRISKFGPFRMKLNTLFSKLVRRLFGITRSMHLLFQIKSAKLAGFEQKYYRCPHVPHPVRRSTLSEFFDKQPELLADNIRYKFRSTNQISAIYLANHLEIANGSALLKDADDLVMINGEYNLGFMFRIKINRILKKKVKFLCLQAVENLSKNQRKLLKKALRDHLNMPSKSLTDRDQLNKLEEI